MVGLLGNIGAALGGLLGSPRAKDALLLSLASGGDPRLAAGLMGQRNEMQRANKQDELYQLKMEEARRKADEARLAQQRQQQSQSALASLSMLSPKYQAMYRNDPAFQQAFRANQVAYGDPAAAEQAGLLAPIPQAAKPTSLMTNLAAMGIDPQSDLGKQIMLGQMLKPQTSVNVNNAPSLPNGLMFVDPNNPAAGAQLLPGYAAAMAALKAAEAGGTQSVTAAAETAEQAKGKAGVTQMISEIAQQYDTLRQGGGITSTQNDVTSNLLASVSKSGLGQAAGSAAGTVNQAARDSISMKRPMLIQAIKNATGMSAQQMNSNVELQQMINMATNPDFGYEVNQQQLRLIDALYGSGTFGSAPANADINALVNKYAN